MSIEEMTKQPIALWLAGKLEDIPSFDGHWLTINNAAAELRRLHAEKQELLEALAKCSAQLTRLGYSANHADQAIAKVTGETK